MHLLTIIIGIQVSYDDVYQWEKCEIGNWRCKMVLNFI